MSGQSFVLAIDIGGTNFRLGMMTQDRQLHHFTIKPTTTLYGEGTSMENLKHAIATYLQEHAGNMKLAAISIGFPSIVSKDKRIVYSSPNLIGFDDINVAEPLEQCYGVPVYIENDVNFLLQYEITQHNLINKGTTLGFYIGTGFGNSIYLHDRFLDGKNGVAGELGHIPVLFRQDKCGCGNEGCIEIYASGKRLTQIREQFFPSTDIKDLFTKHATHPEITRFVETLSIPIATEINIFDPDQVIIGGGVIQMNDFPKQLLEEYILKYTRKPYPAEGLTITYARQDQTTGLLGAGYYAFQKLESANKNA
ncbi:allose kinase [Brevibacillus sp. SYP-B805]|uniref:allose kinase n=1 Tax=Brevibacillus sp. SYP-B805 TaxID=1578199 RepID=UPI0013EACBCC|nr:allose kinase [Brevibacillus sp. SYP-B805]NGQ96704.1 allose kinase [Brevibacillus sp. SYP-B805]